MGANLVLVGRRETRLRVISELIIEISRIITNMPNSPSNVIKFNSKKDESKEEEGRTTPRQQRQVG